MQKKIVEMSYTMTKRKTRKRQCLSDKTIREIVSYVRKLRTQKLSPQMKKIVKRNASKLRIMSDPNVSLKRKRKLLVQRGGFFRMMARGHTTSPLVWLTGKLAKYAAMRNAH